MKKNISAILAVSLALSMSTPAEAGILKKLGHIAKKTVMFPVYFGGGVITGAVTGTVLWYYIGGREGDVKRAFSGRP